MIAKLLSHVLSDCPKLEPLTVQIHFVVIAFSGKVMMPKALSEIIFLFGLLVISAQFCLVEKLPTCQQKKY